MPPPLLDGATLLDSLRQAAVLTDLAATIVYWNHAAELLYGWSREEALGRPVFEVTPTTASRQQGEEIFEAVRLGQPWSGEYPVQRKDSSTFLAYVTLTPVGDPQGKRLGVLGLSEDVAEIQLRQGSATNSAERLQLAVDTGHLGSWSWNRSTGEVLWDRRMEEICGLPPGTFAGTVDAWLELVHPADRAALLTTNDDVAIGDVQHLSLDFRVADQPHGMLRRVAARGRVLHAADGKATGAFGYAHSVRELPWRYPVCDVDPDA